MQQPAGVTRVAGSMGLMGLVGLLASVAWVGAMGTVGAVAAGSMSVLAAAPPTLTMEATAYGPSAQDNYPYGATNYFGQPLMAGDIAVDPSVIPLGSCLAVTGYHSSSFAAGGFIGEADDEGGAIIGNHVDLFLDGPPAAVNQFGIQTIRVTVLGPADRAAGSGSAACAQYAVHAGTVAQRHGARTRPTAPGKR